MKELSPQNIRDCLCPLLCKHAKVQFAFLFGSYAKGRASRLSDIDIAVQVDWNLIGEIPPYGYKADFNCEFDAMLTYKSGRSCRLEQRSHPPQIPGIISRSTDVLPR